MITEIAYYTPQQHNVSLDHTQGILCFDQQKWNLFGLVEPRIDTEGIEAARSNPVADGINTGMFVELRNALKLTPIEFLGQWEELAWHIDSCWPSGYRAVLRHRAHQVHRRLFGLPEASNVIVGNFARRAA